MGETFKDQPKWKWCDNFWELPADFVNVEPNLGVNIPMFGIAKEEEIIRCYRLNYGYVSTMDGTLQNDRNRSFSSWSLPDASA